MDDAMWRGILGRATQHERHEQARQIERNSRIAWFILYKPEHEQIEEARGWVKDELGIEGANVSADERKQIKANAEKLIANVKKMMDECAARLQVPLDNEMQQDVLAYYGAKRRIEATATKEEAEAEAKRYIEKTMANLTKQRRQHEPENHRLVTKIGRCYIDHERVLIKKITSEDAKPLATELKILSLESDPW